jgi:acetyl-CoA acetyltransferase
VTARGPVDVAELHAPFAHQEVILRHALALNGATDVNPSGGALAANPMMAAGLARIGAAAQRIIDGSATRAIAHATSGPCLQQNLVCLLEGE